MLRENVLDEYHKKMMEHSIKVKPYIEKAIREMLDEGNRSERSREIVWAIHRKRGDSPRLREHLLIESYKAVCNKIVTEDIYKIAAAIEIYNLSTYLINWVLDKKGEIKTKSDEQRAIIEGIRLYDKAKAVIRETGIPEHKKQRIIEELEIVNNLLYIGQGDDIDALNVRENAQNMPLEEYKKAYIETCKRKCGYFLGFVARIGAYLGDGSRREIEALDRFATALGTGIQIVNDVADNIPLEKTSSVERAYQDQFSDIENGLITLPVYSLIRKKPEFLDYVGRELSKEEKEELFDVMIKTRAFDIPMKITREMRKKICKPLLRETFSKERRKTLSQATAILDSSKIYRTLRDKFGYSISMLI